MGWLVNFFLDVSPSQGEQWGEFLDGISEPEGAWKGQAISMKRLREPPLPLELMEVFSYTLTQLFSFQSISHSLSGSILLTSVVSYIRNTDFCFTEEKMRAQNPPLKSDAQCHLCQYPKHFHKQSLETSLTPLLQV